MSSEMGAPSSVSLTRLQTMARAIVPESVAVSCSSTDGDVSQLFGIERAAIERAVLKRQTEFAAGRAVARSALAQLGQPAVPIPVGSGRSPIWPTGFVGSISHCRTAAIAVAAAANQNPGSIGIDIEEAQPLDSDLWESTCTKNEIAWFETKPGAGLWAKVIFSIKEAVYKAQYPATARLLDFHHVEISFLDEDGNFVARILVGDLKSVRGAFRKNEEFVLSFAATPNPPI